MILPGPEGSLEPSQELPQLLHSLQRGSRRTRVLLNQGNVTLSRQPRSGGGGGSLMLSLALIWPPAPGIPPAPSLEGSFSGLQDCGNNFLSFSILGLWPAGVREKKRQQTDNQLLRAWKELSLAAQSQGNPTYGHLLAVQSREFSVGATSVPITGFDFLPRPKRMPHVSGT